MNFNYLPQAYNPMPQTQNGGLNWCQGVSGAKAWYVPAGQTALLMDSEDQRFFIKTADASGMPLPLRIFNYTEVTTDAKADAPVYATRDEVSELKDMIAEVKSMIGELKGDSNESVVSAVK